ncbi:MAG: DUF3352 domain-containing protein, partial [Myxococcota bacterium]
MRRTVLIVAVAALAAAALSLASCNGCETAGSDVTKLVSKDAPNAFIMPVPAATFERLGKFIAKFEGTSIGEQAKVEVKTISEKLGFNPLEATGWKKAGFNAQKGFAVVIEPLKKDSGGSTDTVLVMIGIESQSTADKTIRRLAKDTQGGELYKDQRYKQAKLTTIMKQTSTGERPLFVYTAFEGYMVFGDAKNGEEAIHKLVDRRLKGGLDTSPLYTGMLSKVRSDADVRFFVNEGMAVDKMAKMTENEMAIFKSLQASIKGMLLAASLEKGIAADLFVSLSESSATSLRSLLSGVPKATAPMFKTVGDDVLAVFKTSLDMKKLYARLHEDAPAETAQIVNKLFAWVTNYMEIRPEEKIIPLLSGDSITAYYPGDLGAASEQLKTGFKGIQSKYFNSVYSAGLVDQNAASALLVDFDAALVKKGVKVSERQVNGVRYRTMQLPGQSEASWTVKDKMVVEANGTGRLERAVGLMDGAPGGILAGVSSETKEMFLSNDTQVLYLNFNNIVKMLKVVSES